MCLEWDSLKVLTSFISLHLSTRHQKSVLLPLLSSLALSVFSTAAAAVSCMLLSFPDGALFLLLLAFLFPEVFLT